MKHFFQNFYGFFSIILIETGNLIEKIPTYTIEFIQITIGILTIYKLINDIKKRRNDKNK